MKDKKRVLVIAPTTYKEMLDILESYKKRYGAGITVAELLDKFNEDIIILN